LTLKQSHLTDKDIDTNSRQDKDSTTAGCANGSQIHVW